MDELKTTTTTKKLSSEIISVSVPATMYQWYEQHPELNRSKVFQDASLALMYPKKIQIPSHISLIYLLNFVVGICIILVSSTFQFRLLFGNSIFFSAAFIALGITLSMASIFSFVKDRKERKKQAVQN
jgi:hypothetical protein